MPDTRALGGGYRNRKPSRFGGAFTKATGLPVYQGEQRPPVSLGSVMGGPGIQKLPLLPGQGGAPVNAILTPEMMRNAGVVELAGQPNQTAPNVAAARQQGAMTPTPQDSTRNASLLDMSQWAPGFSMPEEPFGHVSEGERQGLSTPPRGLLSRILGSAIAPLSPLTEAYGQGEDVVPERINQAIGQRVRSAQRKITPRGRRQPSPGAQQRYPGIQPATPLWRVAEGEQESVSNEVLDRLLESQPDEYQNIQNQPLTPEQQALIGDISGLARPGDRPVDPDMAASNLETGRRLRDVYNRNPMPLGRRWMDLVEADDIAPPSQAALDPNSPWQAGRPVAGRRRGIVEGMREMEAGTPGLREAMSSRQREMIKGVGGVPGVEDVGRVPEPRDLADPGVVAPMTPEQAAAHARFATDTRAAANINKHVDSIKSDWAKSMAERDRLINEREQRQQGLIDDMHAAGRGMMVGAETGQRTIPTGRPDDEALGAARDYMRGREMGPSAIAPQQADPDNPGVVAGWYPGMSREDALALVPGRKKYEKKSVDLGTVIGPAAARRMGIEGEPGETVNVNGQEVKIGREYDPLTANNVMGVRGRWGGPRPESMGPVPAGPEGEYRPGGDLTKNEKFMAYQDRRKARREKARSILEATAGDRAWGQTGSLNQVVAGPPVFGPDGRRRNMVASQPIFGRGMSLAQAAAANREREQFAGDPVGQARQRALNYAMRTGDADAVASITAAMGREGLTRDQIQNEKTAARRRYKLDKQREEREGKVSEAEIAALKASIPTGEMTPERATELLNSPNLSQMGFTRDQIDTLRSIAVGGAFGPTSLGGAVTGGATGGAGAGGGPDPRDMRTSADVDPETGQISDEALPDVVERVVGEGLSGRQLTDYLENELNIPRSQWQSALREGVFSTPIGRMMMGLGSIFNLPGTDMEEEAQRIEAQLAPENALRESQGMEPVEPYFPGGWTAGRGPTELTTGLLGRTIAPHISRGVSSLMQGIFGNRGQQEQRPTVNQQRLLDATNLVSPYGWLRRALGM